MKQTLPTKPPGNALRRLTQIIPALLIWAVVLTNGLNAQIHYVDPAGLCGSNTPCHTTIAAAIAAASPGETVLLTAPITEGLVTINKAITLDGGGFTLTSSSATWGVNADVAGITIQNITVDDAGTFGIITTPGADNLTITNTTVSNGGGTGFAITCVDGVTLTNITATNNVGNGVSITDCNNVTINGITTSGNAFGGGFSAGIGIFSSGGFCTAGTSNVTVGGAVNIGEPLALYEQASSGTITGTSMNPSSGSTSAPTHFAGIANAQKYYATSLATAYTIAASLMAAPSSVSPALVHVEEISSGNKFVDDLIPPAPPQTGTYTLSINAAITYAVAGKTVFIEDGTYNERVTVSKSITLDGQSEAGTVLDGTGLVGAGSGISVSNGITDVTIQDLTIQAYTGATPNTSGGIYAPANNNNLTVDNVTVQNNPTAAGFYANGPIDNLSITNSTFANHGPGARGIVVWNGLKTNITFTGNTVTNNNCCGIELQDGDASAVNISSNTIDIGGGDNAIGVVGLNTSVGANTINNNTITGGGRYGIEIKNPAGGVTVSGNNVTLVTQSADVRDRGGITIMRRGVLGSNVDVPNGVTVTGNTVDGYQQTSTSEGFGIVVEGTNHTVTGNTVQNCDVGILQQQNPSGYPGDADQSNIADLFFGRGNSPITCGNDISGNTFSGNGVDTRDVPAGLASLGSVLNTTTNITYCSIQAAIDAAATLSGHTLAIAEGTYTENIDAATPAKDITLAPGASPGCVTVNGNLTLNSGDVLDMEIDSTTPCTGHDQFTVNGTVTLGGATLNLSFGYGMGATDQIVLIDNDGADAVSGQFASGNYINVSGTDYYINYAGGSGNDVVLTRLCGNVCTGPVTYTSSITLSTQTQLNSFLSAGCKYTEITGNLTLDGNGAAATGLDPAGSDPITDLCNLQELVSVGGNLIIRDFNVAGNPATLADLAKLQTVGNNLTIGSAINDNNSSFTSISLPALTSVGNNLTVEQNPNITSVSMPLLAGTLNALSVNTNGTGVTAIDLGSLQAVTNAANLNNNPANAVSANVDLGSLQSVGGNLNLSRGAASLDLGALESVGGDLTSNNNASLTSFSAPALDAVSGNITIDDNTSLATISIPTAFAAGSGVLSVTGNTALTSLTLGLLSTSGNATISNNGTGVTAITLSNLQSVGGTLNMSNNGSNAIAANIDLFALTSVVNAFKVQRCISTISIAALATVGGNFTLSNHPAAFTNFDAAFAGLNSVGGNLAVQNNSGLGVCCLIPCHIAVTGTTTVSGNTGNCLNLATATTACTPVVGPIAGDTDVCLNGTVTLDGQPTSTLNTPLTHNWSITGGTGAATFVDNNDGTADFTGTTAGTVFIEYYAEGALGCTSNVATFTLTVQAPPTLSGCPTSISVGTEAGVCDAEVTWTKPTITGSTTACEPVTLEVDYGLGGGKVPAPAGPDDTQTFPKGITTVTYTLTDGAGNADDCSFDVEVVDGEDPELIDPMNTCDDLSIFNVNECLSVAALFNASTLESAVEALFQDNCGTVTATLNATDPGLTNDDCNWIFTYTFLIVDGSANGVTCEVERSGGDTDDPVFTACPTLAIDLGCNPLTLPDAAAAVAAAGSVTDNCGVASVAAVSGGITGSCTKTEVWTVTALDACGNDAICTVTYTWAEDTDDPVFTACPTLAIDLGCNPLTLPDAAAAVAAAGSVTDNCGVASVAAVSGGITGSCTKTEVWTVTALDACGNDAICTVTYTWAEDTDDPVFTACPTLAIDLGCNPLTLPDAAAAVAAAGSVTDNCGVASVAAVSGGITGSCTKTEVWTVTALDACGNDAICTVTYTWAEDTDDPVFTACPTLAIDLGCNPLTLPDAAAAVAAAGSVTDNCGVASVAAVSGGITGSCTKTEVWTVTALDACGNDAICTVTYTWAEDTDDPVFTACPTLAIDLGCNPLTLPDAAAAVAAAGSVTDNCGVASVAAVSGGITGSCTKTEVWTVTALDACGNDAICTVTYTWAEDTDDPVFTACPTLAIDLGCNPLTLPDAAAAVAAAGSVTDNCGVASVAAVSGGITGSCTKTEVWTVTALDACGNDAICTVTYTWAEDTDDPVFTACPTLAIDLGCNPLTLPDAAAAVAAAGSVTDNCGVASVAAVSGGITGSCTKTEVWTVTALDACGNDAICTVTYTWAEDTDDPVFTACPTLAIDLGCNPLTLPDAAAAVAAAGSVTDNCGVASVAAVSGGITGSCTKTEVWTVTALDACGNDAICTVTYTWAEDTDDPVFTACPTLAIDLGCNPLTLPDAAAAVAAAGSVTDNCGVASVAAVSGGITGSCTKTEVWTVTALDACGNDAICTVTYTWAEDTDDPVFTACPTLAIDLGCNPLTLPDAAAAVAAAGSVTDNCGVASVAAVSGGITGSCTKTEVWTVTALDACGNDAICTVTYTWAEDTDDPVFTACPTLAIDLGCNPLTLPDAAAAVAAAGSVTDNCGVASVAAVSGGITGSCTKTEVWTVTALDACGNDAICTVTYTWAEDTDDPVFTACPTLPFTRSASASCDYTVQGSEFDLTATDNCSGTVTLENDFNSSATLDGEVLPAGTTTITWTATDVCGNSTFCQIVVEVLDTTVPTITCPANLTVCSAPASATYQGVVMAAALEATATDNCPGTLTYSYTSTGAGATPPSGSGLMPTTVFNEGTTTVEYTVEDIAGNTASCSFMVTVFKTPRPSWFPRNLTTCNGTVVNVAPYAKDVSGTATQYDFWEGIPTPGPGTQIGSITAVGGVMSPVGQKVQFTPPGNNSTPTVTNYYLVSTTVYPGGPTCTAISAPFPITVKPMPSLSYTLNSYTSAGAPNVLTGSTVTANVVLTPVSAVFSASQTNVNIMNPANPAGLTVNPTSASFVVTNTANINSTLRLRANWDGCVRTVNVPLRSSTTPAPPAAPSLVTQPGAELPVAEVDGADFMGQFTVYPNPFRDQLFIRNGSDLDGVLNLRLYDLNGREITSRQWLSLSGETLSLDLRDLPKGVYVYRLQLGEHSQTGRLMRQ